MGGQIQFSSLNDERFQLRDVATGALTAPSDGTSSFDNFSPDGERYTTQSDAGVVTEWDRATGSRLATSAPPARGMGFVADAFTPDGRRLVAADVNQDFDQSNLDVLDASTLEPVGGAPLPLGGLARIVSVTPDGRQAIAVVNGTSSADLKVLVVDLGRRRIVGSTAGNFGNVGGARHDAVADDGRTVGLGFTSGKVAFVDAMSGKVSPAFQAHDGFVESVSFAPDVATVVTAGRDGAIKLWDTKSRALLGTVQPLGANKTVQAWYIGPGRVLIAYTTGELFEWDTSGDAWEAHACTVAGRNLTKTEWSELFPGRPYRVTCPQFPAGE